MAHFTKKFTIVLDIDNTIMTSYSKKEIDMNIIHKYNLSYVLSDNYYYVERPYIQDLLDFIFKYFNVIVWTAATESYAIDVLNNILFKNPNRKVQVLLSRNVCNYSMKKYKNMKQLKILWNELKLTKLNEHNTILIDDLYGNCKNQLNNCIWIPPFDINNIQSIKYDAINPIINFLTNVIKYNRIPMRSIRHS